MGRDALDEIMLAKVGQAATGIKSWHVDNDGENGRFCIRSGHDGPVIVKGLGRYQVMNIAVRHNIELDRIHAALAALSSLQSKESKS